jgi:uncharacterized protein YjaG (DUF416 family)
MTHFDEDRLIQALNGLAPHHQTAFAASCCERLLPNYQAFAVMEGWGDPPLLDQALNAVWQFLDGTSLPEERVHALIAAIDQVTPDMDDYTSFFAGAALSAVSAVVYTLESCLTADAEKTALVGRVAIETIDLYLDIVNDPIVGAHQADPALDRWLEQAPLMLAEITYQQETIAHLQAHPTLDSAFLQRLRQSAQRQGIQPFARGMVKRTNG